MVEKLTIWNRTDKYIEAKFKLITEYKDMLLEIGEAGDFFPCEARMVKRELVVELCEKNWEEDD